MEERTQKKKLYERQRRDRLAEGFKELQDLLVALDFSPHEVSTNLQVIAAVSSVLKDLVERRRKREGGGVGPNIILTPSSGGREGGGEVSPPPPQVPPSFTYISYICKIMIYYQILTALVVAPNGAISSSGCARLPPRREFSVPPFPPSLYLSASSSFSFSFFLFFSFLFWSFWRPLKRITFRNESLTSARGCESGLRMGDWVTSPSPLPPSSFHFPYSFFQYISI